MPGVPARLAAALLAAVAAPASGQLFSAPYFLAKRQGGGSATSSWAASSSWHSSWVPGPDGQLHQHVHEVRSKQVHDGRFGENVHEYRTETIRDGQQVQTEKSEVACQGGLCVKMVHVSQHVSQWMPRLRGVIWGVAKPQREQVMPPMAPVQAVAIKSATASMDDLDIFIAISAVVAVTSALFVAALFKWHRDSAVSARETPLRSLAEPLAPAGEAFEEGTLAAGVCVTKQPAAAEPVVDAATSVAKAYLSGMYAQAAAQAHARATQMYLFRMYQKVTM